MIPAEGIEDAASADEAVGEVPEDVDVYAVSSGSEPAHGALDGGGGVLLGLVEEQRARDALARDEGAAASHGGCLRSQATSRIASLSLSVRASQSRPLTSLSQQRGTQHSALLLLRTTLNTRRSTGWKS